jgi:hypothetical protein
VRREQFVGELVIVGEQTARDGAQRNHTGAGQRGNADYAGWIGAGRDLLNMVSTGHSRSLLPIVTAPKAAP